MNYQRSRVKATYVKILSKGKAKIVPYVVFGVITTLYGLGVYYVLPLSLLSYNLGLILKVFFFILLGFLLGLILFAINAQSLFETVLMHLLLFWEKTAMKKLI